MPILVTARPSMLVGKSIFPIKSEGPVMMRVLSAFVVQVNWAWAARVANSTKPKRGKKVLFMFLKGFSCLCYIVVQKPSIRNAPLWLVPRK